jgi:carbonic anhydrase
MTPDQVVRAFLNGNARFVAGALRERDFLAEMKSSSAGQYPAAIVLSCIDSRTPVEVISDLGIGDTFNAKVAGGAVNDDILGSMEYACAVAGAKAIVVLGHTACGAIKGAIDNVVLGNLTLLLARFKAAIDATVHEGPRTSKNPDFVDAVARTQALKSAQQVRQRSQVLANLEAEGKIRVVAAMYDVASGVVTLV